MLMRPDDRAIDVVDAPVDLASLIRLLLERGQKPVPDPGLLPAVEATGDRPPGTITLGQVPPGRPGLEDPEDAIDDPPMVMVGPTHARFLWWENWLQALPLRFG